MRPYELPDGGLIDLDKVAHVGPVIERAGYGHEDGRYTFSFSLTLLLQSASTIVVKKRTVFMDIDKERTAKSRKQFPGLYNTCYNVITEEQRAEAIAEVEAVRQPLIDAWTGKGEA